MTMQVGMVGSDGIVLASDTKWTHPPKEIQSSAKRFSSTRDKIRIEREKGIYIRA
jgi:20S proteasome alpha/beta subunit